MSYDPAETAALQSALTARWHQEAPAAIMHQAIESQQRIETPVIFACAVADIAPSERP